MHHRHPQQLRVRAYILPAAYSFGARHGAGARWHGQSRDAIRCILAKDLQHAEPRDFDATGWRVKFGRQQVHACS